MQKSIWGTSAGRWMRWIRSLTRSCLLMMRARMGRWPGLGSWVLLSIRSLTIVGPEALETPCCKRQRRNGCISSMPMMSLLPTIWLKCCRMPMKRRTWFSAPATFSALLIGSSGCGGPTTTRSSATTRWRQQLPPRCFCTARSSVAARPWRPVDSTRCIAVTKTGIFMCVWLRRERGLPAFPMFCP